jgi:spore maturation protein CgeB
LLRLRDDTSIAQLRVLCSSAAPPSLYYARWTGGELLPLLGDFAQPERVMTENTGIAAGREQLPAESQPPAGTPRVLVVGHHIFPDALEWHIVESLRRLGCATEFFQSAISLGWTPRLIRQGIGKFTSVFFREPERLYEARMERAVRDFEPTLILVTLGNQLSPKTVKRLRGVTRARIACWCQDQMTTLGRQFLLGSEYDAVFVKDRYMHDLFSRMVKSTSFFYLPEACNPRVHRTVELTEAERKTYGCEVMIAGTLYYYRQEILRHLAEFDLKVWGTRPDWLLNRLSAPHSGREVFADDKARAANGARICLNTLHYGEVDGLNVRAFELAGCGGFQMITSVPVLAEHFQVGSEIVAFKSVGELVEMVRHYLDHPDLAGDIALRGQLRAHREHTYEHRLQEILRVTLGHGVGPVPIPRRG